MVTYRYQVSVYMLRTMAVPNSNLRLHINDKHYLEPNFVPQIEVWQLEDFARHKFGIKYQLDSKRQNLRYAHLY